MLRAIAVLLINLINLMRSSLRRLTRLLPGRKEPPRRYVRVKLPTGVELTGKARKIGPIKIGLPSKGSWWVFDNLLKRLARDRDVEGIYFKAEKGPASLVDAAAVADRLAKVRRAGKRVVCHMDQGMVKDYVVATAADTVTMTPPGRLYSFGLRLEMMFLADAFEKAGIKAQFVNLGRYKTAMHRFTRSAMTRPQMIMMQQLAHGMNQHIADRIARRRGISAQDAQELFARAPISGRDARRLGFVDHTIYADALEETLQQEGDCNRAVELITSEKYLATSLPPFEWKPLGRRKKPQVAVLDLKGTIMQGNEGGLTGQIRNALTPEPVIKAVQALAKDKSVKAVVLRIDSPGGSALASDLMWRQIRKLAESKPVIASLGNVAASGGYYIAVAAHEIVAHPETITGSIGVIAGKLSGGELLEKLGVRFDHVDDGHGSGFMSLTSALGEDEMINLRRDIRGFYRRFLHRVSQGRKISRRKVHRLGRGRVYTGSRAKAVGLVDHLGGLEDAIEIACKRASVERDDVALRFVDHSRASVKGLLGAGATASFEDAPKTSDNAEVGQQLAAELIPEDLHPYLAAAMLMRKPSALALMPALPQT